MSNWKVESLEADRERKHGGARRMKRKTKKEVKYSSEVEVSRGTVEIITASKGMRNEKLKCGKSAS